MKRRNREINIFSISALDIFASAMGVFMLMALIALPSLYKTDSAEGENLPGAKGGGAPIDTFLMVVISWTTKADIDLYVTDPKRNIYSFQNKTYEGDVAELSVDANTTNEEEGGVEMFTTTKALPGDYDIHICKYGEKYNELTYVTGLIISRLGVKNFTIPGVETPDTPFRAPSVNVSEDGQVTIYNRNTRKDNGTRNDKCILLR
jgi:hypothetical protein